LEEQITIEIGGELPHKQTGEAGACCCCLGGDAKLFGILPNEHDWNTAYSPTTIAARRLE
jgi:hypothetical protein